MSQGQSDARRRRRAVAAELPLPAGAKGTGRALLAETLAASWLVPFLCTRRDRGIEGGRRLRSTRGGDADGRVIGSLRRGL